MTFTTEIPIDQPRRAVLDFFRNPESWFRLNPEWEVRKLTCDQDLSPCSSFTLEIVYDRSEIQAIYLGKIEEWPGGEGFTLSLAGETPRRIQLTFAGNGETVNSLVFEELAEAALEPRQQTELVLWLKSTADYIEICSRRGWHWRLLRSLLEKIWLRLTPTGRRVVFLVIAFELAGLVLLIGLLMVQRWL